MEPGNDALGSPDVTQHLYQTSCEHELAWRRSSFLRQALEVSRGHPSESRLICLRDPWKRLFQISDKPSRVIVADAHVLVERIAEDVTHCFCPHKDLIERVERTLCIEIFKGV